MPYSITAAGLESARTLKARTYRRVAFMAVSAVVACGGIIVYYNQMIAGEMIEAFASRSELAAVTLMPYMVSAVIAALTAVGAMSILPTTRYVEPSVHLVVSLREVGAGDLTTRLQLRADDPLRDIANELNLAVGNISNQVTQWKVINRIQWGVLCRIRMAAEHGDCDDVLHFCEEMEGNWDKIAEIEQSLRT